MVNRRPTGGFVRASYGLQSVALLVAARDGGAEKIIPGGVRRLVCGEGYELEGSARMASVLSHKLMVCLEAVIASSPARSGSRCSGGSQASNRGLLSLFICKLSTKNLDLWLFMPIYSKRCL